MNDGGWRPNDDSTTKITNKQGSLVESAMEKYLEELESGRRPDRQAFLTQYPEIAEKLQGQLETLEFLYAAAPDFTEVPSNDAPSNDAATETSSDVLGRTSLGDFKLLRTLGRGGMGVVFEARQLSLDRRVAVKILPFAAMLDSQQLRRFHNEARAAAALDHPSIVPIYFVGQERGVHFYAMQLIEGQSLAQVIAQLRGDVTHRPGASASRTRDTERDSHDPDDESDSPISTLQSESRRRFFENISRLGSQAAEALEHAHQQGVIHRDVKPGNLLLDEDGKLWITDFGLARHDRNETITMEGDVLGTLAYMSPEQRSGSQLADARSDIYSLGATLYELATLTQPFSGDDRRGVVGSDELEPTSLRKLAPQVPVDLETIILKSMAREAQERYQTAGELAADLNRFRNGRTILARRPSAMDRVVKWTLRHRAFAATGLVGIIAVCVAFAVATLLVARAQRRTQLALDQSEVRANQVADLLYVSDIQLAYQAWNSNRPENVREVLDRQRPHDGAVDRRGVEWHLLDSLVQQPESRVVGSHVGGANQVAVFPGGRRIATVGDDQMLRVWDLQDREAVTAISMGDSSVEAVFSVAISPDGETVATGSDTVLLWNVATGERIRQLTSFDSNVQSIAYSPDGTMLACASRYDRVRVFDRDGTLIRDIPDSSRHESLEFTPDSQRLIVPSRRQIPGISDRDGFLRVWDTRTFRDPQDFLLGNSDLQNGFTIAINAPDGSFIVACESSALRPIRLIDPKTGAILLSLSQSRDNVNSAAISDDGRRLAVAYSDGSIACWVLARDQQGRLLPPIRPILVAAHRGVVRSVKFVDNDRLISCGEDGEVKLWTLPADNPLAMVGRSRGSTVVEVAPDGESIAYLSRASTIRKLDAFGQVKVEHGVEPETRSFACSSDLSLFAVWSNDHQRVDVKSFATGQTYDSIGMDASPSVFCFSPDRRELAVIDDRGELLIRDLESKRVIATTSIDGDADETVYRCKYSKDGQSLVCTSMARGITVLDRDSYQVTQHTPVFSLTTNVDFAEGGALLATAHDDGVIRLWEWPTVTLVAELKSHEGPIRDVAFVGSDTLLSTGNDKTTRIWSVTHRRSMGVLQRRGAIGKCVTASDDGSLICCAYEEYPHNLFLFRVDRSKVRQTR